MYIAAKGGEKAIQEAEALFHRLKGTVTPDLIRSIAETLPYLVDRVMGEASCRVQARLATRKGGGAELLPQHVVLERVLGLRGGGPDVAVREHVGDRPEVARSLGAGDGV
ncbi:MAG: carbon-phosphorus lyase complex subunit PhnI, partial [Blastochloris sp.]|nr:carbon-phosphorus lyase complex subunit PhnI [Blastochloris sp.]